MTRYHLFEGADYVAGFNNLSTEWTRRIDEAYRFASEAEAAAVATNLQGRYGYETKIMIYDELTKESRGVSPWKQFNDE